MYAAGLSSSTVLKIHRIISRALTIAVRRELVGRNAARLIEAPEPADFEPSPYSLDDARKIMQVTQRKRRNRARWSLALALGLRQGEVIGLRWSDINLETGEIRPWYQLQKAAWRHGCSDPHACGEALHRPKCAKNCRLHVHGSSCKPGCTKQGHTCPKRPCPKDCVGHAHRCPKRTGGEATFRRRKGKKKPVLMCPPELLPELRQQKIDQDKEKAEAGEWDTWDVVFSQPNGSPLDRTEDWKEWKAILSEAGVHNGRLHDARHTAGALMAAQGIHVRVIQEMLGHARVTTTERYTMIASQLVQDAGNRLGSVLWGTENR